MTSHRFDELLLLVDDPFPVIGGGASRRVLDASRDFHVFAEIALAEAEGTSGVALGHFGLALALDPRGRRVLSHLGLDPRLVEARFHAALARPTDVTNAYRSRLDDDPPDERPLARALRRIAAHPPATARTLLMAMTLEPSTADVWRGLDVTLATVMNCPADVQGGDVTLELVPAIPELDEPTPREVLERLFVDALAFEPREARAAAIALQVRARERFTLALDQEQRLRVLAAERAVDALRVVRSDLSAR